VTRTITVSLEVLDEIRLSGEAAKPLEACGLLVGYASDQASYEGIVITQVIETRNAHPTPETHFEIEPQALINAYREERDGGPQLIGYFHSHPVGEPVPSATDQAQAPRDGRIWAIVAGDDVRFWQDLPGGFKPVAIEISEA